MTEPATIEAIEVFHVAMPMKETWRTAFSDMNAVDSVLVRLVMDGVEGWGEAAPYAAPQYCAEFAAGAFLAIRDHFAPALLGAKLASAEQLQERLRPFKGNHFAKSALDAAWWDAHARISGRPLWRVIGGKGPDVEVGADISVRATMEELLSAIRAAVEQGFKRTKLKFRPGSGVEMIARVREAFPELVMHIDCNSGFTLADLPLFKELDRFGLAMIEQPLAHDDLLDHKRLQQELQTPLCLDESITSLGKARKAIEIGACRWVNLKVGRVGGLTNALAINAFCAERGIPCWTGGMLESAVGQGASMALATLANMRYPADIFPSARFYERDLGEPEITLTGASLARAPERPGHGFAPRPDELSRLAIRHAKLEGIPAPA